MISQSLGLILNSDLYNRKKSDQAFNYRNNDSQDDISQVEAEFKQRRPLSIGG